MLENLSLPLAINWVDLVILVALLLYAIEGYSVGFISSLLDLVSFIVSFIIGLKIYAFIGKGIGNIFSISAGFSNALGFLIAASFSEIILGYISRRIVYNRFFSKINFKGTLSYLDRFLGACLGMLSALILFSFILSVIVALPLSVFLKRSVSSSKIGSFLVSKTSGFEKDLNNVFGGAVNDTLNFLTIEPKSTETVNLNFKTLKVTVDEAAEAAMFASVNKERTLRGLSSLDTDKRLTAAGRAHCVDMLKRGYFSHNTPEGLTPFDRMAQADVGFTYAGENLALAPNVETAMQGLMNSPGHKANILSVNFGTAGIGVIDGGIYGQMYCQEFTD
ncbi:MAG: CvpA family protein [Patescibacteria group bacterium]